MGITAVDAPIYGHTILMKESTGEDDDDEPEPVKDTGRACARVNTRGGPRDYAKSGPEDSEDWPHVNPYSKTPQEHIPFKNYQALMPLLCAAKKGDHEEVDKLIDEGFDVHDMDMTGFTPLMHAAQMGHIECVKLILAEGADPTVRFYKGMSGTDYHKGKSTLDLVKAELKAIQHPKHKRRFTTVEKLIAEAEKSWKKGERPTPPERWNLQQRERLLGMPELRYRPLYIPPAQWNSTEPW